MGTNQAAPLFMSLRFLRFLVRTSALLSCLYLFYGVLNMFNFCTVRARVLVINPQLSLFIGAAKSAESSRHTNRTKRNFTNEPRANLENFLG